MLFSNSFRCLPGSLNGRRVHVAAIPSGGNTYKNDRGRKPPYNRSERKVEEKGWWEVPVNQMAASNPLDDLTPWQIRKLEQAYSIGRRKIQVSALADDLGVDRSIVVEWFKRFSAKPESERNSILGERKREVAKEQQVQSDISKKKLSQDDEDEDEEGKGAGFVPFKIRRQQPRGKKIKQDVLRTLEMVYERTTFPPDDVIRGLWDLHKIPRSMAIEWFAAKRKEDGLQSSKASDKTKTSTTGLLSQPSNQVGGAGWSQKGAQSVVPAASLLQTSTADAISQPAYETTAVDLAGFSRPDTNLTSASSDSSSAKPQFTQDVLEEPTVEGLAVAYGEMLVKASKTESELKDFLGVSKNATWKQVMTRHYMKKGLPLHKRIDRSFWLSKLIAIQRYNEDDLELLASEFMQ